MNSVCKSYDEAKLDGTDIYMKDIVSITFRERAMGGNHFDTVIKYNVPGSKFVAYYSVLGNFVNEYHELLADWKAAGNWCKNNKRVTADKAIPSNSVKAESLELVRQEVIRARNKFPHSKHLLAALTEEVGELAQALLQSGNSERSKEEAIQVACVALRIIEEGDREFDGSNEKA